MIWIRQNRFKVDRTSFRWRIAKLLGRGAKVTFARTDMVTSASKRLKSAPSRKVQLRVARTIYLAMTMMALLAAPARGQEGNVASGKAKAKLCAACHGENGVSTMKLTPSLAGQPDEYVQWQLVYFRSGARKNPIMQPIADTLKNQDIRDLGAYYASLKPPKPAPTNPSDQLARKGEMIAKQQRCASCHYDKFEGYRSSARLASQREDVLLKALHDFKSGARVGSGVASMGDAVYPLDDEAMKALAHFMATRP